MANCKNFNLLWTAVTGQDAAHVSRHLHAVTGRQLPIRQRGWRDQNRKLQWLRAVTHRARAPLACMTGTDAFRLRWGFCFSIPQGGGPCSPLRVYFRRQSSATGGKESRSAHRGRVKVWTSQLASQPKQLVGEQGESRTQDRSRNPASREDSDHSRSARAGRR